MKKKYFLQCFFDPCFCVRCLLLSFFCLFLFLLFFFFVLILLFFQKIIFSFQSCIGQKFALNEEKTFLAMIYKKFIFRLAPDQKIQPEASLILRFVYFFFIHFFLFSIRLCFSCSFSTYRFICNRSYCSFCSFPFLFLFCFFF